jgi:hypothetical protein
MNMNYSRLIWLLAGCLQLALIAGAVSFTTVRMPIQYGSPPLPADYGPNLQRAAWEAFINRNVPKNSVEYPILPVISSRIFIPFVIATINKVTGLSWGYSFSISRLIFMGLAYLSLFWYLRRDFSIVYALLGTLFMAATIPIIYNNPYEIPTEFPEIIFFTLGLYLIFEKRYVLLFTVIAIATLNRETSCFLPLILLFVRWSWPLRLRTIVVIAAAGFSWLIPLASVRWWLRGFDWQLYSHSISHNLPGLLRFFENFNPFNNYLFYLYLFGVLWFLPFIYWKSQPQDMQRTLLTIPIMLAVYLFGGGFLNEPREIVAFYPILVPAGLYALVQITGTDRKLPTQKIAKTYGEA